MNLWLQTLRRPRIWRRGPEMNRINFSYVWDKLRDPEFTTIRMWNKEKEEYYRHLMRQRFQVWKNSPKYPFKREYVLCHAWLYDVAVMKPADISITILEKDTTLNGQVQRDWIERFQKQDRVLVLFFTKAIPTQNMIPELNTAAIIREAFIETLEKYASDHEEDVVK